jgi:colicin import membrane protein
MAVAQQPNWFSSHWPYLLGAVVLHAGVAALFALTMIEWQSNAPPPTLAIQAFVVDENQLAKPTSNVRRDRERARKQAEAKAAAEAQLKQQEEAAKREQQELEAEQERAETLKREQQQAEEQEREKEQQLVRERETQERIAKEKAAEQQQALERQKQEEADRQRKAEAERQAKLEAEKRAKADAERKRVEEIQRKQREREEADRRRVAAESEARERALQEQLAEEESLMQARSSGAMNQYAALIQQHVMRQWNRPPSARSGIQCEVNVRQSRSGAVLRVQVGTCNGDQAVRLSIENAVQRASPLPLPSDMRLFTENLRFDFKPAD